MSGWSMGHSFIDLLFKVQLLRFLSAVIDWFYPGYVGSRCRSYKYRNSPVLEAGFKISLASYVKSNEIEVDQP